jgi:predicted lipid-binding transport protein (Tim44 family)
MRRTSYLLATVAALSLALAPGLADARAGGGSSSGSRGSMTYSAPPTTRTAPTAAQPLQRSMTPNTPSPGVTAPGSTFGSGMGARSGFASGLMGGLIGVGIGGLLFGHGFMGGGMAGFSGFLGLLLQIGLVVLAVSLLVRWFRRRQASPALAGGPNIFARGGAPEPGMMGGSAGPAAPQTIQIAEQDFQAFEQLLKRIQASWSQHDLGTLRTMVTPEMLSYFSEQLSDQASRGARNEVSDVQLLQGDLAQAWREGNREYATVAMRFSMVDVTRDSSGRVIDGSLMEHVTATELWTFVRSSGGQWILSAIQQAR